MGERITIFLHLCSDSLELKTPGGSQLVGGPDSYPGAEHKRLGGGTGNETELNVGTTFLRFAPGYESGPPLPSPIPSPGHESEATPSIPNTFTAL